MKRMICLILIFVLCTSTKISAGIYKFDFIKSVTINNNADGLEVSGTIPNLQGFNKNIAFQKTLNDMIYSTYKSKVETAKKNKIKFLKIDYDTHAYKNIVSIIMYFATVNTATKNECVAFNFNIATAKLVNVEDILGVNAIKIIDKTIKDELTKSPELFDSANVSSIYNFFVDDEYLVIAYDEFELSAISHGIMQFKIPIPSIVNANIKKTSYYTKGPFKLKMVPLRDVCDAFGYNVKWNDGTAEIIRGTNYTSVTIGKNSYYRNKMQPKSLEYSPELKDEITYVPISFFSESLDLIYSVKENGDIVFSECVI